MDAPATSVVYDAGALLAAEANDRRFRIAHRQMLDEARHIIVPAPVLTQVWRGGARQALLARVLRSCKVEPTTEQVARYGGVLLAKTRTSDAVDAIVVASALPRDALIVTSDPDDLSLLWRAAETGKRPKILAV
jgi:PIN domain